MQLCIYRVELLQILVLFSHFYSHFVSFYHYLTKNNLTINQEQENEVGRKMLATLRTAWLVDEQSRKRRTKSRYKIVQYFYDTKYIIGKWIRKLQERIKLLFQEGNLQEFVSNVRSDLASDGIGAKIGAIFVAVFVINIV
jgi:hypothetical protein